MKNLIKSVSANENFAGFVFQNFDRFDGLTDSLNIKEDKDRNEIVENDKDDLAKAMSYSQEYQDLVANIQSKLPKYDKTVQNYVLNMLKRAKIDYNGDYKKDYDIDTDKNDMISLDNDSNANGKIDEEEKEGFDSEKDLYQSEELNEFAEKFNLNLDSILESAPMKLENIEERKDIKSLIRSVDDYPFEAGIDDDDIVMFQGLMLERIKRDINNPNLNIAKNSRGEITVKGWNDYMKTLGKIDDNSGTINLATSYLEEFQLKYLESLDTSKSNGIVLDEIARQIALLSSVEGKSVEDLVDWTETFTLFNVSDNGKVEVDLNDISDDNTIITTSFLARNGITEVSGLEEFLDTNRTSIKKLSEIYKKRMDNPKINIEKKKDKSMMVRVVAEHLAPIFDRIDKTEGVGSAFLRSGTFMETDEFVDALKVDIDGTPLNEIFMTAGEVRALGYKNAHELSAALQNQETYDAVMTMVKTLAREKKKREGRKDVPSVKTNKKEKDITNSYENTLEKAKPLEIKNRLKDKITEAVLNDRFPTKGWNVASWNANLTDILKIKNNSKNISKIQETIGTPADGKFGPHSLYCLRKFLGFKVDKSKIDPSQKEHFTEYEKKRSVYSRKQESISRMPQEIMEKAQIVEAKKLCDKITPQLLKLADGEGNIIIHDSVALRAGDSFIKRLSFKNKAGETKHYILSTRITKIGEAADTQYHIEESYGEKSYLAKLFSEDKTYADTKPLKESFK